jgi:hypothetical protein
MSPFCSVRTASVTLSVLCHLAARPLVHCLSPVDDAPSCVVLPRSLPSATQKPLSLAELVWCDIETSSEERLSKNPLNICPLRVKHSDHSLRSHTDRDPTCDSSIRALTN